MEEIIVMMPPVLVPTLVPERVECGLVGEVAPLLEVLGIGRMLKRMMRVFPTSATVMLRCTVERGGSWRTRLSLDSLLALPWGYGGNRIKCRIVHHDPVRGFGFDFGIRFGRTRMIARNHAVHRALYCRRNATTEHENRAIH
jgi:hypothetical protein